MKTTIDIPDSVYRKVKAKSALEGRPVRDVAIMLFRAWVEQADELVAGVQKKQPKSAEPPVPRWFGALNKYAVNAGGRYDMESIRGSIARGRTREERRT